MKNLSCSALLALVLALAGCSTMQQVSRAPGDWATGLYHATAQQAQVANMRASAYFARLEPAEGTKEKYEGPRYLAVRTLDPTPEQWQEIRTDMAKPASRYGAAVSAPPQVHCVMIWDTQSQQIVGTNCYTFTRVPAQGATVRFDTYTAQFVGTF